MIRRLAAFVALLAMVSFLVPASAEEAAGNVVRMTDWTVKPGMNALFREGLKRHNDFHRRQNDTWGALYTWRIISGDHNGQYLRGTFGHKWADFDAEDKMGDADDKDTAMNLDPYMESGMTSYYLYRPELSKSAMSGPAPMVRVIEFRVRIGQGQKFEQTVGKINEVLHKVDWPDYEWYERFDGGDLSTMVLALPKKNWADMAPPAKSVAEVLKENVGPEEAGKLFAAFGEAVESETSYIAVFEPALSYVPAKK